ncbi:hypothetical protein GCM10011430_03860 [Oxalicibacterium solurbis]|uniref:Tyr recombinase domain-containing protein n=2 Tax=Oxalicibacterium solurbis TaxID=69280 RepID=A0A8J3AUL4_9BURK|nr:hypothetical protein GCM10011430_03860 [Oxalicibacterium solurbis]
MVLRRKKIDRSTDIFTDDGKIVDLPPGWEFIIDCQNHGPIKFDFNLYRDRGREEIAEQLRNTIWSMRHSLQNYTLKSYENVGIRRFWKFLDYLAAEGEFITQLKQVDRKLINRFLTWMDLQNATSGVNRGEAFSTPSKLAIFIAIKSIFIYCQKRDPESVNRDLSFPRNPYPNSGRQVSHRQPYSQSEQKIILSALNKDLKTIHERQGKELTGNQVLCVYLLVLAAATGRNLTSLLELQRDSIQEHALPDREFLVTYKRRGYKSHATSIRKADERESDSILTSIPSNVADHFRFLSKYTEPLMKAADERDRNFVMLKVVSQGSKIGHISRMKKIDASNAIRKFSIRHDLKNDRGERFLISISRLRPTMATELYQRTGDIRKVQKALGHAHVQTTARHYASKPFGSERNHAFALDGMVSSFIKFELEGKVFLAADGKIPLANITNLLGSGYNTGIARCSNPFRENESVCNKYLACFKCPNMCVFEDDLWRLYSFYYRLLSERSKIHPTHWLKTYGPIIRRIDTAIASQFPPEKIEAAREKARETPHPTWKDSIA